MDSASECLSEQGWAIRLCRDEGGWVAGAQTVGMAAHGLPDFMIRAVPYQDNPHAELELDAHALSQVLDQVIAAWRQRPLRAGRPIKVEAYQGWKVLIDPVSDTPAEIDAAAKVILLRWKLAPLPPAEPVEVCAELAAELQLDIIALNARTPEATTLRGLEHDDVISFRQDQRFGPLTPWVVANARAMLALESLDVLVVRMEEAAMAVNPHVHEIALVTVAGSVLRTDAVRAIRATSYQLCRRLKARADWKEEVRERAQQLGSSRSWARNYLSGLVDQFVSNTLLALALQDVIREELLLSSLGAWNSIISPDQSYAGDRWRCHGRTSEVLRGYFADMDEDQLVAAVAALDEPGWGDSALGLKLIGSTLVRKASPPPLDEFVGPGLRELLEYRGARSCVDQIARLIAALCEPPDWLADTDLDEQRQRLSDTIGVAW